MSEASDTPDREDPDATRPGAAGRQREQTPAERFLDLWESHLSLTATAGVRRPAERK